MQSNPCQQVSREGDDCNGAAVAVERAKRQLAVGMASKAAVLSGVKQRPGGDGAGLGRNAVNALNLQREACAPPVHRVYTARTPDMCDPAC